MFAPGDNSVIDVPQDAVAYKLTDGIRNYIVDLTSC